MATRNRYVSQRSTLPLQTLCVLFVDVLSFENILFSCSMISMFSSASFLCITTAGFHTGPPEALRKLALTLFAPFSNYNSWTCSVADCKEAKTWLQEFLKDVLESGANNGWQQAQHETVRNCFSMYGGPLMTGVVLSYRGAIFSRWAK